MSSQQHSGAPLVLEPQRTSRRLRCDGSHGRERGAALLLAFLAILVLTVVITQMSLSATVDRQIASNTIKELRADYAARGAFEQAKASLITDLRDEQLDAAAGQGGAGGDSGGSPGGAGGAGGASGAAGGSSNFGGAGAGAGGQGQGQDPPNDSIKDAWADPSQGNQQFGDCEVKIRIIDEDRKFNVLAIVARDPDFAKLSQERLIRLIDTFRQDSKNYDLTSSDAKRIVESMVDWLKGNRLRGFPTPPPLLVKADPNARFDDKDKRFKEGEEEPIDFPLSFDEFLGLDGMTPDVMHAVWDKGEYVPGLEDVCTVYSNLAFDSAAYQQTHVPTADEQAAGGAGNGAPSAQGAGGGSGTGGGKNNPGASGGKGGAGGFSNPFAGASGSGGGGGNKNGTSGNGNEGGGKSSKGNDEEADAPPTDEAGQLTATETNQGRVNVNTASLRVLRVLAPEGQIPDSIFEKIDEFRRTAIDEELLETAKRRGYGKDGTGKSQDNKNGSQNKNKGGSNAAGKDDKEDDEDALKNDFSFHDSNEVFDKVADFYDTTFEIPDDAKTEFGNAVATKSSVFTIYVEVRGKDSKKSGRSSFDARQANPPDSIYRAVVWRRKEGDSFQVIPILPLHAWAGILPPDDEDYRKKFPFGF